jgi:hypothetical protein
MRKSFSAAFDENSRVYLKAEPSKRPGFVIGYVVIGGLVKYKVAFADGVSNHLEVELTTEYVPDFVTEDE